MTTPSPQAAENNDGTRRAAARATALFYAMMFAGLGAHLPFWSLWLEDWGLSAAEVGLITSLGMLVRIGGGFLLPVMADRLGARRRVTAGLCVATVVLFLAHLAIETRASLILATLLAGTALAGFMPLGEALGASAARRTGFSYAPVRAIGSVGFLVSTLIVGFLVRDFGTGVVLWWIVVCFAITAVLALSHPGGGGDKIEAPATLGAIGKLFADPVFLIFVAASAFGQASHAVLYVYSSLHWRALGVAGAEIGALWSFGVAVEIAMMLFVGTVLVERLGAVTSIAIAAAAGVLRWGAMMSDPLGLWLWPLQGLHAITFGLGHLGAIAFLARAIPERLFAAAQGGYVGLAQGVLTALAMFAAALVYPRIGGGAYGIALAMSAVSLVCCFWLARRWRGEQLNL